MVSLPSLSYIICSLSDALLSSTPAAVEGVLGQNTPRLTSGPTSGPADSRSWPSLSFQQEMGPVTPPYFS